MAPRLGKFGTTIYHGVCTWVIEWVSEWSYAYQSPHKNFLTSFRYHKLKMNKFFYMSKLKLPKGCTCEEYANRWLHVPQCFALWVAIIFIITHTVNGFYLFSREQIDCVNAELHENDFIIDNFFTYYECAIAWVIEYIVNVYFELIPLGKWLFVFDCNIKILQCSNRYPGPTVCCINWSLFLCCRCNHHMDSSLSTTWSTQCFGCLGSNNSQSFWW